MCSFHNLMLNEMRRSKTAHKILHIHIYLYMHINGRRNYTKYKLWLPLAGKNTYHLSLFIVTFLYFSNFLKIYILFVIL